MLKQLLLQNKYKRVPRFISITLVLKLSSQFQLSEKQKQNQNFMLIMILTLFEGYLHKINEEFVI
ncbi:hypothetical protein pb186bvf_002730 [Paramecium bursaria]